MKADADLARDAELEESLLSAIRALSRAVDSHSRRVRDDFGLTLPQVIVLKRLAASGELSAGALATAVGLGQPTIKVILDKLEGRKLVRRARDHRDRRSIRIQITDEGRSLASRAPSLLTDAFWRRLTGLEDWERTQMLSSIQRLARLMAAAKPKPKPEPEPEPEVAA